MAPDRNKEKQILSTAWTEITPDDLRYLYFELNYMRANIATAFGVTIKQVEYKLRKYGLNKLKKWTNGCFQRSDYGMMIPS